MGQNPDNTLLSCVTKVICRCMLTVAKSEVFFVLIFSVSFSFFFVPFFCLGLFWYLAQYNVTTLPRQWAIPQKKI